MEWTKETLIGTCIKINNMSHGKRILAFYASFGIDTNGFLSSIPKVKGQYYGVFQNKVLYGTTPIGMNVIKLPANPRRKFPREMMVSDDKRNWTRKEIIGKIKHENPFIAKGIQTWRYAKEID